MLNAESHRTTTSPYAVCAATVLLCLAGPVMAQEPETAEGWVEASAPAGYSQQELSEQGFVAADSVRPGDTVSGGALLVAAYALIWSLAVLYVVWLARRHSQNVRRMLEIDRRLERMERTQNGG